MFFDFLKKHLKTLIQFSIVGAIGVLVNFAVQISTVFILGSHFLLTGISLDDVLGIGVAMVSNYFLNYYWTFRRVKT